MQLGLRHRHGAQLVGRHGPDQERLHAARRSASTSRSPATAAATSSASASRRARRQRRDAVAPFKEYPGIHGRLDGPGLLRRRHLPQLVLPPMAATATCTKTGTATARPSTCRSRSPPAARRRPSARSTSRITKVEPVVSGSTGTGGSGGGTASCAQPERLRARSRPQYQDAHVMCPKDYIVQNNAWGSTAGQTVTFGPGHEDEGDGPEREPDQQQHARRLPVDLHRRVQQPQHHRQRPAARDQLDRRRQRPDQLDLGRPTARPAATTPPTTSGSAPARAAIRRRRRRAAAS